MSIKKPFDIVSSSCIWFSSKKYLLQQNLYLYIFWWVIFRSEKIDILGSICLRRDRVNLLVYRPDRRYFKQKQKKKIILQKLVYWVVSALGETMLICWSTGPTDHILNKSKKNNITKFGPTGFLLIYYFLLFEKKERKKK